MAETILRDRDTPLPVGAGRLYLKVLSADEIELTSGRYDVDGGTWKSWGIEQSFPWGGREYEVKLHFTCHPDGVWRVGKAGETTLRNNLFGHRYFETRDWRAYVPVWSRFISRQITRDTDWLEDAAGKELNLWVQTSGRYAELLHAAEQQRLEREVDMRTRRVSNAYQHAGEEVAELTAAIRRLHDHHAAGVR